MLSLSVPAIDTKPAIHAEVHLKRLQEMITGLPIESPQHASKLLLEELQQLNRQQVANDSRFKALEIYRRAVIGLAGQLARHYCGQPLPLSDSALGMAQLAQTLLTELAYGYKHCIIAEQSRLFTLGSNKQLATFLQRAIDTLARRLVVNYQTYASTTPGIWAEIHQLYLYALQQSLQDARVEDIPAASSINHTYKRALLLALADTHHLVASDIDAIIDYLHRFAQHAQLQPFGTPDNANGVFLIHLKSDKAPLPLSKFRGTADLRTDILLLTIEMARQVHQHLSLLQTGEPPAKLNLPESAADLHYQDLLSHLLKQWGIAPKRQFTRIEKNEIINLCAGLPAIHHLLSGKPELAASAAEAAAGEEISLNFADSPIDNSSGSFKSARWMVVNESAGGMALSKFANVQVALRVGELLALRAQTAHHWSIAALRWASTSEDAPLSVGAQMLAPDAEAVEIWPQDRTDPLPALLLPELPALSQPASLIMARGNYRAGARLEMQSASGKVTLLQTRLIERTPSFERFAFSREP